ncbi:non-hydrolyzing UDP-N-acetylglucosamine 2-epimerase [Acinetobacter albensis]|uniref:UDP-N-acetylglucosamine 2-epimerase (non-hydrolyzing) n=1 Tax=Acinetobacter albensis TaxID=1673609 RepID=A0ABW9JXM6_9GAMM
MIKVLFSFGTRPEAIKMAPLIQCLRQDVKFEVKVLVTAQHREMLDQVLDAFKIKTDFDLNLMLKNQSLNKLSANILSSMDEVYEQYKPDIVLVHGDTLSAFVVAQSAFYNQIDIGHIEAGLRTYNLKSPWPEEGNRQLISKIACLHFAPTALAALCLKEEKVKPESIFITGNTVIDALLSISEGKLPSPKNYDGSEFVFKNNKKRILITGHRRENFGQGFINICQAIRDLAIKNPEIEFIYPVHMNPNVKNTVFNILAKIDNIILLPPQSYFEFVNLMKNSNLILTDSGGIQEEAPSLGIPVLVMRDTTERQEAIDAGTVKLVGTTESSIKFWVEKLLSDNDLYQKMSYSNNPYGDGKASFKIKDILLKYYSTSI